MILIEFIYEGFEQPYTSKEMSILFVGSLHQIQGKERDIERLVMLSSLNIALYSYVMLGLHISFTDYTR